MLTMLEEQQQGAGIIEVRAGMTTSRVRTLPEPMKLVSLALPLP
jgi:hypothetical protein